MMSKKNKSRLQKKKQKKAMKSKQRRKDYLKEKRTIEEVTIHWDDLNFLDGWKSLSQHDLMQSCFKFTVDEWVVQWVSPKRLKDYRVLHHVESIAELLQQTFDNTLDAWSIDTKGFTENLPIRYQYNEKNKNRFLSIIKNELGDEYHEEDTLELMDTDRSEWFSTVFSDTIDDMVAVLSPYVFYEVQQGLSVLVDDQ
tara:strand:+ start:703 stop:1293 length:591 start_codon:yes stop_codon:yes gene_type:complete